jgi:tetratricopeptide (TPR) repeat protein
MFRQVVALAPDSVRGHSNLGGALLLQGRFAAAIPALERSLALRPTGYGYSNLATAYFKQRRFPDAIGAYEQAIEEGDEGYAAWGNLGDAYYWSSTRRSEAPAAYGRAIELAGERLRVNPQDPEVLCELAKFHAMLGEPELAVEHLDQALSLAPGDAELQFTAAIVHNQLGRTSTALDRLEKALEGGVAPEYVQDTPEFDNLREDEKFRRLFPGP